MQTEQQTKFSTEQEVRLRLISSILSYEPFFNHDIAKAIANYYTEYVLTGKYEKKDLPILDKLTILEKKYTETRLLSIILLVVQFILLVAYMIIASR